MPQLIAMIIIVVGAMIYMFQTFGGTGDKIEGIAQKTSIITEINNIKNGLKLAARAGDISISGVEVPGEGAAPATKVPSNLQALGKLSYFAEQINEQLIKKEDGTARTLLPNIYSAISFGGSTTNAQNGTGSMLIHLVSNKEKQIPGIYVDLSKGGLSSNAGFLESQIANDLAAVAIIDRLATATTTATPVAGALRTTGNDSEKRTPVDSTGGTESDGKFIIYFQDFGANEVVVK